MARFKRLTLKRSIRFLVVLSLLGVIILTGCKTTSKIPQVGDLAPDFALVDSENNSVSLKSFSGKVVLLEFWATY